jgi:signal transduction histidine kinase
VILTLRDGSDRQVVVTASPLSNKASEPDSPGAVVVYRDVTEERRKARQLADFAGTVAHDLRSPLSATLGWLDLADEVRDDHQQLVNAVGRARGGVDRMAVLISELLSHAVAEGGELQPEAVELGGPDGLVAEVAAIVDPDETADILAEDGIPTVQGDPDMLTQLLTNLIGNAMKYVAPGKVPDVRLTGRCHGNRVELELSDNGIGIPEGQRDLVFERFHRAHPQDARYPGTGLGLAICRTIVERHGGRIVATSGPDGVGTTFRFDLPAAGTS